VYLVNCHRNSVTVIHNGIEFGMLQAIAEGVNLLEEFRYPLDIKEVLRCWRNGSVIRSWLIDPCLSGCHTHPLGVVC